MEKTNITRPFQRFWALLKPDKLEIRNVYFYAIFNGFVYLTLPLGIQAIINLIQGGQISTAWMILVIVVLLGIAINGVLTIAQMRIVENLQQKIFTRAAFEFAYRIPKIRLDAIYQQYAPELMNRFFDIISVQKGLAKILISLSTATIQIVFGLVLLSFYHPFFIVFSSLLVLLLLAIFKITFRRGLETSLNESKHKYKVAHWLEEVARNNITFKLAGETNLPLDKMDGHVGSYLEQRENHFKALLQQFSLLVGFKVLIAAGLLIIGSILVMEQQMNIGQFVASEIIILLVLASVEKFITSLETIYDVLTSLEKLAQVTDLELETENGDVLANQDNLGGIRLELNHVKFNYPGSKIATIKDFNLSIQPGQKLLITGSGDSGKSTILHLLAATYPCTEGYITYDDINQLNLDPQKLRSIIGDCLMEEKLFEGTILENITIGRAKATEANIKWALKNLGLAEFIKSTPGGLQTLIQPEGQELSASTVTKLLLARSIADKPKLLLIKDNFQSLVKQERNQIIDFLTSQQNLWTLVSVSSDPYFAQNMDEIIHMEDGTIIEKGDYKKMKEYLN